MQLHQIRGSSLRNWSLGCLYRVPFFRPLHENLLDIGFRLVLRVK